MISRKEFIKKYVNAVFGGEYYKNSERYEDIYRCELMLIYNDLYYNVYYLSKIFSITELFNYLRLYLVLEYETFFTNPPDKDKVQRIRELALEICDSLDDES